MQMKYRTRIYYTEEQKTVMWDRWQKGDSFHAIARLFDHNHSSIAGILARTAERTVVVLTYLEAHVLRPNIA